MSKTDRAITEYEALKRLSQEALHRWKKQQPNEAILVYEALIPGICGWLQTYKSHIQVVSPPGYPNRLMMILEEIKLYWLFQFITLLESQQVQHPLRKFAHQAQEEINQLLEKHFYFI